MSKSTDDGGFAPRVPPTVSKDKSLQLALNKLSRGWIIVLGSKGKNANFFKPGKGFDPMLYSVAKKLIELDLIREDGSHFLGTKYVLAENADPTKAIAPTSVVDDDDEEDDDDSDSDDFDSLDEIADDSEEEEEETDDEPYDDEDR